MADKTSSPFAWWAARRLHYNIGLVVAGILAFVVYAVIGSTLLPDNADFEITLFTIFFQGLGYVLMIGIANLCCFLGPLSEKFIRPLDSERYRLNCYRLGFWFSVLLPFSVPSLLFFSAFFRKG
jgi:hypothetical protein